MKTLPSLSIFFPAYNDVKTIAALIEKARRVAQRVAITYEIIVVNDGSTDGIENVVKHLPVRLITHTTNKGYGAALRSGFAAATNEWVFYTDGDGQYDPSELTKLVSRLSNTIDVVNGYKIHRADSWYRVLIGKLYNWYLHRRFSLPIRDVDCDFRLIRRSLLQKIHLTSVSGTICVELITKLHEVGARFAEAPIHHYPRRFGHSEFFHPKHLLITIKEMISSI